MNQRTVLVAVLAVAALTMVGAASFTTADVVRNSNIDVSADDSALIGLSVGGGIDGDSVTTTSDGEIEFDLDESGQGVNGNATFYYGAKTSRVQGNTGFNVTNNDDSAKDITFSYAVQGTDNAGGKDNVKFHVYEGDGSGGVENKTTATEQTDQTVSGVGAGSTLYVFIEVDTTAGDLGKNSDLSGELTITAS